MEHKDARECSFPNQGEAGKGVGRGSSDAVGDHGGRQELREKPMVGGESSESGEVSATSLLDTAAVHGAEVRSSRESQELRALAAGRDKSPQSEEIGAAANVGDNGDHRLAEADCSPDGVGEDKRMSQVGDHGGSSFLTAEVACEFAEAQNLGTPDGRPEGTHRTVSALEARIKYVHDCGVKYGRMKAVEDGLSPDNPRTGKTWEHPDKHLGLYGQGPDELMFDGAGDPVFVEYKGVRVSDVSDRPADADINLGTELTDGWVYRKIETIAKYDAETAGALRSAHDEGRLTGRVYVTPVDANGNVGETYEAELARPDLIPSKKQNS